VGLGGMEVGEERRKQVESTASAKERESLVITPQRSPSTSCLVSSLDLH
jgi:hypothetical protein